jgi:ribosomal protein S18 acetylase RimI-like enzyme
MNFKIKNLDVKRWKEFKDLRLDALLSEPTAFGRSYEYEEKFKPKIWKDLLKEEKFLFALVDDKVVGMIGYRSSGMEKTKHIAMIIAVYVQKKYRGLRIGYKLYKEILRKIKTKKFKKISIGVNSKQLPALRLYEKFGFEIVGHFKKELKVKNKYYDEYILEKII